MKSKKRIVTGIVVSLSLVLAIVGYQIADRRIVAEVKSSEANVKLYDNAKYILFLNWSEQRNAYWIHALYQGKINIDGKDLRERDLYLHDDGFKKLKDSAFNNLK
ncbi:hypothetical protein [Paenibacillus oceani]|uniref:Uncharacterized protein n=1 Tax=Paenibacillus oceani TaxID=2772510 RepID=A0A927CB14_9BACL|nr:hypothetical protein [Paenibacillus oceani]MBD2864129.1 hypothetical protein [Paenibacillus oceani]